MPKTREHFNYNRMALGRLRTRKCQKITDKKFINLKNNVISSSDKDFWTSKEYKGIHFWLRNAIAGKN